MGIETELESLVVRLVGDGSDYDRMLKGATAEIERASRVINSHARKIESAGRSIRNIGLKMTAGITLPVAGMVKSFASFDDAMTQSTAIMGNVSAEMRSEMEQTARTLSLTTKTGATELARSYFYLASAGMDAVQSIKALPVVEQFATAGAFDMAQATDLLTDAQSALGLSSKDAEKNMRGLLTVSDVLVKANTLANASVEQFSQALTHEAGAAIKQYNMDLNEGVGILAAYADQGIKGEVAGSMFGRMTRLLIKSINDNRKAFELMNIPIDEFAKTGKNMTGVIEGISKAVEGLGPAEKAAALEALGFEARIQQAVLPLLGATDKIRDYTKELDIAGGVTKDVADKQLKSFSSQMKIVWNNIRDFANDIGQFLAPYIEKAGNFIKSLTEYWRGLDTETKKSIALITGMVAALGPLLMIIGSITAALGGMVAVAATAFAPTAIAAFGAALPGILAAVVSITAAIAAIGAGVKYVIDLNKIKGEEGKQKDLAAINKEMKELISLQKEQESIIARQTQLKSKGHPAFDPNELQQAKENVNTIVDSIKKLNEESQGITKSGVDPVEKMTKATKDLIEEIKKEIDTNYVNVDQIMEEQKQREKLHEKVYKQIDALRVQYETYGMTASELEIYNLKLMGATEEEIKSAEAILKKIEVLKKETEVEKERKKLLKEGEQIIKSSRTEVEKLSNELTTLKNVYESGGFGGLYDYDKAVMGMAKSSFTDMPSMGMGGGELGRLYEQEEQINEWYANQLSLLNEYRKSRSDLNDMWNAREIQITQQHADAINKIETARSQYIITSVDSMLSSVLNATESFAGQESDIYQGMLGVTQAFGVIQATLNMLIAISNAGASLPYPENIAAMIQVGVEMGAVLASIAATAIGMGHSGIDSVPETGSWYLKKGERIVTGETSAKLDKTLDDVKDSNNSPINVNVYEAPGTTATVSQRSDGGIDVQIELIERGIEQRMSRGIGLVGYMDNRYERRY